MMPQMLENRLYEDPWPEGDYRFFQLAWVVDDLYAAAQRWVDVHGVGPFHVIRPRPRTYEYRSRSATIHMQYAVAQAGPIQIELIQQLCDSPSVYRDLFPRGGAGVHHICTVTRRYDARLRHYTQLGYVAAESQNAGRRVAYIDTSADFGLMTELVEASAEFTSLLAAISAAGQSWTGEDPIRILTRDGYRTPVLSG